MLEDETYETIFTYDQSGRQTEIEYDNDETVSTTYDYETIGVLQSDDSVSNEHLRKVSRESRDGVSTYQWIDAAGQIVQEQNAFGGLTHHVYDSAGNRSKTHVKVTEVAGVTDRTTAYQYDDLNRLRITTQKGIAGAPDLVTRVDYYNTAPLYGQWDVVVIDPAGSVTKTAYDSTGAVIAVRRSGPTEEPGDQLVINTYDYGSGITVVTTRTTSHDGEHALTSSVDTYVTRSVRNTRGDVLLTAVRNEIGNQDDAVDVSGVLSNQYLLRNSTKYGEHGNPIETTDGEDRKTFYAYDYARTGLGIVSKMTTPSSIVSYQYDSAGNRVAQKQQGHRLEKLDNKQKVVDSEFANVTYQEYDLLGRLTDETTQVGIDATIDAEGVRTDTNEEVTREWTYDELTTTYVDRNGVTTQTTFNPAQQTRTEVATYLPDAGSNAQKTQTTTTTYYSNGSVRSLRETWALNGATFSDSKIEFTYDAYGRQQSATTTNKFQTDDRLATIAEFAHKQENAYHENGALEESKWSFDLANSSNPTFTTARTTNYELDSRGRIFKASQTFAGSSLWHNDTDFNQLAKSVEIAYSADGKRQTLTRQGGGNNVPQSATQYSYSALGKLSRLTHQGAHSDSSIANSPIAKYVSEFDVNDRLTLLTQDFFVWGGNEVNRLHHVRQEYTYNEQGERILVGAPTVGDIGPENSDLDPEGDDPKIAEPQFHDIDGAGNRVDNESTIVAGNRLLNDANFVYEYDKEGNLTQKLAIATGDYWTYTWDRRGRMLSASFYLSGTVLQKQIDYRYDAMGRQTVKQVTDPASIDPPIVTAYVHDGAKRQFEINVVANDSKIDNSYFYAPGGDLVAVDLAGLTTYWTFADPTGSVRTTARWIEAGSDPHWSVAHRTFGSYGEQPKFPRTTLFLGDAIGYSNDDRIRGNDPIDHAQLPVIFQGGFWDDDSQLYKFNGRSYDAVAGRFITDAGGLNGYAYSSNAPERDRISLPDDNRSHFWNDYVYFLDPANNGPDEGLFSAGKYVGWTAFAVGSAGAGIALGTTALVGAGIPAAWATGISAGGATFGAANGVLQTWAENPDAGFHEYAFGIGLSAGFGGVSPIGGAAGFVGSGVGAGIGYLAGDTRTGLQIGGFVGDLVGGGGDDILRAIGKKAGVAAAAWHATKQTVVTGALAGGTGLAVGYATGDVRSGLLAANLATFPANVAAQRLVPCFPAGTPVLTPAGPRAIEDLRAGDLVLSRDEAWTGDGDDGTAAPEPKRIEEHFVREGELWDLHIADEVITATPEHPFFVREKGWTPAGELEPGDLLSTDAGKWLPLDKLVNTGRTTTVYNLRVADYATYFVTPPSHAYGVWVHNTYAMRGGVSTDQIRSLPGVATGGETLPVVHGQWLQGGAGRIPGQIASALRGKNFSNIKQFREAFWLEVAADPTLITQFSRANQSLIKRGLAPVAPRSYHTGRGAANTRFNLDHIDGIGEQHSVEQARSLLYDLDNIQVLAPFWNQAR
ncbi:MAG: polymorphic toxin-type HINT domain-containing protein [Planctomycetota bacterium]